VSPRGLLARRLGYPTLEWGAVVRERAESGVRYHGRNAHGTPQASLSIVRKPCRDTMSGAYFALSAVLRLGKETWSGCALEGAAPLPL